MLDLALEPNAVLSWALAAFQEIVDPGIQFRAFQGCQAVYQSECARPSVWVSDYQCGHQAVCLMVSGHLYNRVRLSLVSLSRHAVCLTVLGR